MQAAHEQSRVVRPLLDGIAEQRLDLRARVEVRAELVEGVDVRDQGQVLDEAAVALLGGRERLPAPVELLGGLAGALGATGGEQPPERRQQENADEVSRSHVSE